MPCSATTTRIQMMTDSARSAYDAHLKVGIGIKRGRPVSAISCAVAPTKRARSVPRDIDVTAARRRLFTGTV